MGDRRFLSSLDAILQAPDRARAIYDLPDEGIIQALAALSLGEGPSAVGDPLLANVLATEALNRMERARVIAGHLGEGVYAVDATCRVTFLNPAAERMVGLRRAELVGRQLHEVVETHDVDGRRVDATEPPCVRVLRTGETVQSSPRAAFTRRDGTRFPVAYTAAPILRGGIVVGAVIVFRDRTEEERAARALREEMDRGARERDRLQAVLSGLPVAVFIVDRDGSLVEKNAAVDRLWGPQAPLVGSIGEYARYKGWDARTGEPLGAEDWAAARALSQGVPVPAEEVVIETFDGHRKTILNAAVPIRDAQGAIDGAVVVNVDITERKLAEEELARQKELYATLVQAQSDLGEGLVLTSAGRIHFVNDAVCAMTGHTREEILGMSSFLPLVDPADREEMARRVQRRMAGHPSPDRYGIRLLHKDGHRLDVEISVKTVGGVGGTPLMVALVRDVTEERRKAWEAREAEERYRLLVDSVEEYAILMLDPEGRVMSWNRGAHRITGHEARDVLGRPVAVLYPADDATAGKPEDALRVALERGQFEEEAWRVRKDGTRFWSSVVVTPVRGPDGGVRGYVAILRDLTSRLAQAALQRRAEEQANRTHELETFSYTVAHDLRAPLRAMIHLTEFLERDHAGQLDGEGRKDLQALRRSAERMGLLVEDLLNLSRSSNAELRREEVDVTRVANHVLKGLRERDPDRRVETRVQEGLRAHADPNLTRVVLDNLLGNAWKFTRRTPDARIEVGQSGDDDGHAAFYVRDNGAGFDPAKAHDLFKPFRRLHAGHEYEGTGIGLATVQRIVTRHGGRAWAEGRPGQGATVWFTLPAPPGDADGA